MLEKDLLSKLTRYFEKRADVAFAFLFGSHASGITLILLQFPLIIGRRYRGMEVDCLFK